jgi:hypothetical protein
MKPRMTHRLTVAGVTVGLALSGSLAATAAHAARPVERTAAAPVVVAKVSESAIHLSASSVRAGKITFKVADTKAHGDAVLQVLRLHKGYTAGDLQSDIGPAFSGDIAAIGRLDDNVSWLSGAQATVKKAGWFDVQLSKGSYILIDQDGNGFAPFTVHGTAVTRTTPATHASILTFTYGFATVGSLPHDGWVRTTNRADQPHFIIASRVKQGTTARQVAKFIKGGAQGNPSFALHGGSGIGVLSPGRTGIWKIDLPKGEYLLQCFWPDRMDGLPHFFHGMWKLVQLH